MKKLLYILTISMILFSGCKNDFAELNKNPNGIKKGSPETLLSQTVYNIVVSKLRAAKGITHDIMGYSLYKHERSYIQRFDIRSDVGDGLWNRHYTSLQNLKSMYDLAVENGNTNYQGIAITLKAFVMADLVDTFRDVPYFEATQGENLNFLPKYDKQEDIYRDLLAELDRAALLFNTTIPMDQNSDLLFGSKGSLSARVTAWKKLCNSLRLRLYLRVSKDPSFKSAEKIADIFNNSGTYPYITDATDNAHLQFTNELPFYNPYYNSTTGGFGNSHSPTNNIIDMMLYPIQDIRLTTYFNRSKLEWTPMPQGFALGDGTALFINGTSTLNNNLRTSPKLGLLMSSEEVKFILAEVRLKGWITSSRTPLQYLEDGNKESAIFWTTNNQSDSYNTAVKDEYNAASTDEERLAVIIKHKYLAYFFRGLDAWFEYRRTGYPNLNVLPSASNSGIVPSRLMYPVIAQRYNPTNYQKAVAGLGGKDDINIKSFWAR